MSFPPPSERQARTIWFAMTTLAVALSLALIGGVFWGLALLVQLLSPVLWPLAIAVVLAYLLSPVVNWLESRKLPRLRAVILVFAAVTVLFLGALGSVIPRAIVEARDLASQLPTLVTKVQTKVEYWLDHPPAPLRGLIPAEWQKKLEQFQGDRHGKTNSLTKDSTVLKTPLTNSLATNVTAVAPPPLTTNAPEGVAPGAMTNLWTDLLAPDRRPSSTDPAVAWWAKALDPNALRSVGSWFAAVTPTAVRWALGQVGRVASWFGLLAGLFLVPVYAFFLLLEEKAIARSWTDYLPVANLDVKRETIFVLRSINDALIVFFRGQVLVAFCDGILYALGFLIIGLPYALLIGLMACFVTIIPFLGAALTCGTALIIALVQFGDWQHLVLVFAVFAVVQTIEGFVLVPKIVGDRVGLHPLMVIVALMLGTTLLGGILGGILAIPFTAALRVLLAHYVWKAPGEARGAVGAST
ncbi:MAG TPA: AI-2E family transporter [Verrucomicrobiota bacterium]|nr:AI-2E family transporter [Verrucomicrobiota bacterium]